MSSLEEIRGVRLEKLEKLRAAGINPYPAISKRTHTIAEAAVLFDKNELDADASSEETAKSSQFTLAGRVMSLRGQGALIFFNFFDGTGTFQGLLRLPKEGEKQDFAKIFALFNDTVDVGDFVEVTGTFFKTRAGQQTILVSGWNMLTKSILPLPEKWHGLQDIEERYRKRYLDILSNPELRELFEKKSEFWQRIRNFMLKNSFMEVDTPTLEITTGGAEANPFKTHHRDFDLPVFLRISVGELWQKRLMAAGFPRTFEIGRVYRNEGSSPEHLQEFTNLEFYAAYMDYQEGIKFTQSMLYDAIKETFGKTKFSARGHEFDLDDEWKMLDYVSTVEAMTGINVLDASEDDMRKKLDELGVSYTGENRERLTDTLWKYCRRQIAGPAWLVNHPKLVSPLSKAKLDDPRLTERVQLILAGAEATNGFSELNDPIDQRARFDLQRKLIESGDEEAMMPEWEFVDMLEHGMPPTFGFGFGERLFSFLVDKPIREVQLFPLMKPEGHVAGSSKKKERDIAVVVLNKASSLLSWQKMNAVGHLAAAFAARSSDKLLVQDRIKTADDRDIKLNISNAIIIKEGGSQADLMSMLRAAEGAKLQTSEFTREMLESVNDKKVIAITKEKNMADIEHLGILIFGPKSMVDEITKDTELAQ